MLSEPSGSKLFVQAEGATPSTSWKGEFFSKNCYSVSILTTGFRARGFLFSRAVGIHKFMNKILAICGGLLASSLVSANDNAINFHVSQAMPPHFELAVAHKPLTEVLKAIADTTGIVIHIADEPQNSVTATCDVADAKQLFDCLLEAKADLVFRYGQVSPTAKRAQVLEEVWVVRTYGDTDSHDGIQILPPVAEQKPDSSPMMQMLAAIDTGKLLTQAQANDPESRANAIATLAVQPIKNDPAIRKTVAAALADQSAEVRAQAVFALAKYDDAEAADGLATALQDSDVSVRLMVVDSADNHQALLQQALDDSDEAVRAAAASKLETLASQ